MLGHLFRFTHSKIPANIGPVTDTDEMTLSWPFETAVKYSIKEKYVPPIEPANILILSLRDKVLQVGLKDILSFFL